MSRRLRLAALVIAGLASARAALAGDPPADPVAGKVTTTEADRAFFAWWDAKGFPDVRTLPFITLSEPERGGIGGHDGDEEERLPAGAFLMRDDGQTFTVFQTDLQVQTLTVRAPDAKKEDRGLTFQKTDLAAWVRKGLAIMSREGPDIPWFRKADPFGAHRWSIPNQSFRIAVLARALAARGEEELARTLCDRALHEATRPMIPQQWGEDDPRPRSTYDVIQSEIVSESAVVLLEKFGDGRLSWADLLAAHEAWAKAFAPENLTAKDGTIATLRRMVEEARARTASPPKPVEQQSPAERIETLVHDLQEVGGYFSDEWGYGSTRGEEGKGPPPADVQLRSLGFEAVPALIDALDDVRYTRMLEHHFTGKGQYRDSYTVVHVGELAWMILDQIASGSLEAAKAGGPPTSGRPTRRRAAEEWFASVQARGERAMLEEQVAKGVWESRAAAERLVQIDPVGAVQPLEAGILAGDEASGRTNLVYVLVTLKSDAAMAAMLRLLEPLTKSEPGIRVAAALWAGGRRQGLDALIQWWKDAAKDGEGDWGAHVRFGFGGRGLIAALAATGSADAIRALSDGIGARPAGERVAIVRAFVPRGESAWHEPNELPMSPEAETAIEALLAELLADGDRAAGMYVASDSIHEEQIGEDPVVGEMAAWTLARRYPQRWSYDAKASAADRKAARLALANRWRAQLGQAPLATAPAVRIEPLAAEKAEPLVETWLAAGDEDSRARAGEALFAAGLGALPFVRAARDALGVADPRRERLEQTLRRLASIVREVRWSEKGPRPNASLTAYAEGVRGKVLTGAWITGLWRQVVIDLPEGSTGIDLVFHRPDDGTGGVLLLELTTQTVPWAGGDGGWILSGDGLEHVDDEDVREGRSWWHESRGPQVDDRILVPETKALRMRWTLKRARG